jgi:hypothetical protein
MWNNILDTYKCLISCRKKMPGMKLEDAFKTESGAVTALDKEYSWLQQFVAQHSTDIQKSTEATPITSLPNIEVALKVVVTKYGDTFRADPTILSGSPICGTGKTEDAAKYNLCVNWLYIIAKHYSNPNCSDSGYVPIILALINDNANKPTTT